MKKVILFKGGVETLEFFSLQIQDALTAKGYETFLFDMGEQFDSFNGLLQFCRRGEAVLITFNFIGLSGETIFSSDGRNFFDEYEIKCINIVVDHPFYYNSKLRKLPADYIQFCIDKTHMAYMKRFFPKVRLGEFLPLAGTSSTNVQKKGYPLTEDRKIDILFVGNYTPPQHFEKHLTRINDDYTDFYYGIIEDLISHTDMTMDYAFEKHIRRDIPDISDDDLAKCMEKMIFIDLYLRFYIRGKVIRTLVDSGFKIDVYGLGLDMLEYKHPENLIMHGSTTSAVCLKKLSRARISLNVMPWFKDGLHDRVLSASMNGAVSLTDKSKYMCEVFDNTSMCFYSLDAIDMLPEITASLLKDTTYMQQLADKAHNITAAAHTWADRTAILCKYI